MPWQLLLILLTYKKIYSVIYTRICKYISIMMIECIFEIVWGKLNIPNELDGARVIQHTLYKSNNQG